MTAGAGQRPRGSRPRRNANAVKVPAAIHWYEGMLLAPQHFQTASLRGEALPYYHASAVSGYHWGLMDLVRGDFGEGVVTVTQCEAVMPDGLVVTYPPRESGAESAARSESALTLNLTKQAKEITEGKRTVYLAVASHQAGKRFRDRYDLSDRATVADDASGGEYEVEILRPRLQLVLADELPSSYSGFPLVKVDIVNGRLLEQPFEPPWLRVKPESRVFQLCADTAARQRNAAKTLADRVAGESASTHGAQILETRMLIAGLAGGLPPFETFLDSGVAHPFPLYLAFTSLLGNVAAGSLPPRVPAYDHENLLACFESVARAIGTILDNSLQEPYTPHRFHLDGMEFNLPVTEDWLSRELVLGVRVPQGRTQGEVDDWVAGSTIGSKDKIASLRQRRMSGVSRERLRDHELLPMAGVLLYKLRPPFGDLLTTKEQLVVANHGEPEERRPEEIILYVRKDARP